MSRFLLSLASAWLAMVCSAIPALAQNEDEPAYESEPTYEAAPAEPEAPEPVSRILRKTTALRTARAGAATPDIVWCGDQVEVLEDGGGWARISTASDEEGWVPTSAFAPYEYKAVDPETGAESFSWASPKVALANIDVRCGLPLTSPKCGVLEIGRIVTTYSAADGNVAVDFGQDEVGFVAEDFISGVWGNGEHELAIGRVIEQVLWLRAQRAPAAQIDALVNTAKREHAGARVLPVLLALTDPAAAQAFEQGDLVPIKTAHAIETAVSYNLHGWVAAMRWSPDGRRLLVSAASGGNNIDLEPPRSVRLGLFALDPAARTVTSMATGQHVHHPLWLGPDRMAWHRGRECRSDCTDRGQFVETRALKGETTTLVSSVPERWLGSPLPAAGGGVLFCAMYSESDDGPRVPGRKDGWYRAKSETSKPTWFAPLGKPSAAPDTSPSCDEPPPAHAWLDQCPQKAGDVSVAFESTAYVLRRGGSALRLSSAELFRGPFDPPPPACLSADGLWVALLSAGPPGYHFNVSVLGVPAAADFPRLAAAAAAKQSVPPALPADRIYALSGDTSVFAEPSFAAKGLASPRRGYLVQTRTAPAPGQPGADQGLLVPVRALGPGWTWPIEGWVPRKLLQPLQGAEGLRALVLEGGFAKVGKVWRYRLVLKNGAAHAVEVPRADLWEMGSGKAHIMALDPQVLAAKQELVLFDSEAKPDSYGRFGVASLDGKRTASIYVGFGPKGEAKAQAHLLFNDVSVGIATKLQTLKLPLK